MVGSGWGLLERVFIIGSGREATSLRGECLLLSDTKVCVDGLNIRACPLPSSPPPLASPFLYLSLWPFSIGTSISVKSSSNPQRIPSRSPVPSIPAAVCKRVSSTLVCHGWMSPRLRVGVWTTSQCGGHRSRLNILKAKVRLFHVERVGLMSNDIDH